MFIWLCSLSCETINSGNRNCPWLFCLILGVFPCARLPSPALILWKMFSLIVTLYDMFYWYQREACCFLKKKKWRKSGSGKKGMACWDEKGKDLESGCNMWKNKKRKQNRTKTKTENQRSSAFFLLWTSLTVPQDITHHGSFFWLCSDVISLFKLGLYVCHCVCFCMWVPVKVRNIK